MWLNFNALQRVFCSFESAVLAFFGATNCKVKKKIMRWQMQQEIGKNRKGMCANCKLQMQPRWTAIIWWSINGPFSVNRVPAAE